ncbi:MAG: AbrB/MazE/SpoVT family DNA-binding domain-containing protein [Rhodoferax sp.]|nr:AbrB/MazE/SpoVT family DNA-binding domain-containing protein [Rhodoferax sp.]
MYALPLIEVGDSLGLVIPAEELARLNLGDGDTLFLSETDNGILLTTYDPALQAELSEAQTVMKKRIAVLRALAK